MCSSSHHTVITGNKVMCKRSVILVYPTDKIEASLEKFLSRSRARSIAFVCQVSDIP